MFADPKPPVDESSVLYQNPVRRKFGGRQKFRCRQKFYKTCRQKFSSSPKYWPQAGRVIRKGSGRPKGVFPLYWHFLMYFNLNSKLLPSKSTQKVNKQKIRCKNSGFVLVVRMS